LAIDPERSEDAGPCPYCGNVCRSVWGIAKCGLVSRSPNRDNAIDHPRGVSVFMICDTIVGHDRRIAELIDSKSNHVARH